MEKCKDPLYLLEDTEIFYDDIRIADFDLNDALSENCFVGFLVEDKQKVFF